VCSGSFEDDHERFTLWPFYCFIVYGSALTCGR
jgi:hypothetical protein